MSLVLFLLAFLSPQVNATLPCQIVTVTLAPFDNPAPEKSVTIHVATWVKGTLIFSPGDSITLYVHIDKQPYETVGLVSMPVEEPGGRQAWSFSRNKMGGTLSTGFTVPAQTAIFKTGPLCEPYLRTLK